MGESAGPARADERAWETLGARDDATDSRVIIGGLLGLIAVVLLPLVQFRFVYDDWWTFVSNGFLRRPSELALLLSPEAVARNIPDAFRPTLVVFDVLTYQVFGTSSHAHHLLSIGLHVLVCWLLARWLARLGAPLLLQAASMTMFGLLAVHAEAIAVISFREDLLAAALGLLALLRATHFSQQQRGAFGSLLLAALLMALACGAKMSAATLPLLWLLASTLRPWSASSGSWPRQAPAFSALCLGLALALAHTTYLHGGLSPYVGASASAGVESVPNLRLYTNRVGLGPVLAQSTQIHLGYLQQITLPWGLSPEYTDRGASWSDPATVLASASLLALAGWGLWSAIRRRHPLMALAILGGFALALPTSNLAAMPNMRADRFVYLTSAPVCVGLSSALLAAGARLAGRNLSDLRTELATALRLAPLAVFCIVQGAVLLAAAQTYRTGGNLWTIAVERAPDSSRAHAVFAEILLAVARNTPRGEQSHELILNRVAAHCEIAKRLDRQYELPEICLARLAVARRAWGDAERHFIRALELSPDRNSRILASLAQISLDVPGVDAELRRQRSQAWLARGLRDYPYSPELRAVAGRIAHIEGDPARALEHYRDARSLAPERLQTSIWGLELALDLGDAHAARKIWVHDRKLLGRASESQRASLLLRIREVERLFPSRPQTTILFDGVFYR